GSVTIHLSSLKKHPGSCQLEVKNVDRLFEIVSTTGVQILYDGVGDRDWGCRDFTFRDSSGNIVTFSEQL
ncbi:MAG: hypothetical protein HKN25_02865, partial [Pyrinomonadaceae bacterium]|nr:hypothetical protein [Pyrinomonadaceae bacterium]